jgi:predicted transcriptional regulator of viral defense system
MDIKYNKPSKTLGHRMAGLITRLNENRLMTFRVADAIKYTGLSSVAVSNLLHKAQQRGLVTRLKPGLFNLVPFELGDVSQHIDNPCIIAREIVGPGSYFLSFGTAFELHRMVTQPILTTYVSSAKRIRPQTVGGYDFRFIKIGDEQVFGVEKFWVDKERFVLISDLERTLIDGLKHPEYVGGMTEVAKGLWMKKEAIQFKVLIEYAQQLGVSVVLRRLGYLLERYELADENMLRELHQQLSASYHRLDPQMPSEGPFLSRWKLQLNVSQEELDAVRFGQ